MERWSIYKYFSTAEGVFFCDKYHVLAQKVKPKTGVVKLGGSWGSKGFVVDEQTQHLSQRPVQRGYCGGAWAKKVHKAADLQLRQLRGHDMFFNLIY